jgi:uncharacterized protein (TIGR03437 family)
VLFNDTPAPILYTSANQIAAVAPYELAGASTAQIVVQYGAQSSAAFPISIAPAAPGLITADASGAGQAAAVNQDGSLNNSGTPAVAGSLITLSGTGGGQTSPAAIDGAIASTAAPQQLSITATIGGQPATVQYAGTTPGEVSGIMQIKVQIPSGVTAGSAVPVAIEIGGVASQSGVTIAVSGN